MKRFFALILSIAMLWSCLAQPATALAASADSQPGQALKTVEDIMPSHQAMHFILRHWHSSDKIEKDVLLNQLDNLQSSGSYYFVVFEGYIVPNGANAFDFYLVDQRDKSTLTHLDASFKSPYVERFDTSSGEIVLKNNPVYSIGKTSYIEDFSSYSVSAGHSAAKEDVDNETLTIKYDANTHLVKAHAFYKGHFVAVRGTNDTSVFGTTADITDSEEEDTAYVYMHEKTDEILKVNGKIVTPSDEWPSGVNRNDYIFTKVYNTQIGLHTDKTAQKTDALGDDRTFNLDLEAWYVDSQIPVVGMVLDASGSMAFAADEPKAINIADILAKYDSNDPAVISLKAKIDGIKKENDSVEQSKLNYVYPQRTSMIAYYAFNKGTTNHEPNANGRDWLLNGVTRAEGAAASYENDGYAGLLAQQASAGNLRFEKSPVSASDLAKNWPTYGGELHMAETNGDGAFHIDGNYIQSSDNKIKTTSNGIILNLNEQLSENFTISFKIKKNSGNKRTDPSNLDQDWNGADKQHLADVLYIGSMNPGSNDYIRVVRNGDNAQLGSLTWRAWLTAYQGNPTNVPDLSQSSNILSSASSFHNPNENTVTYVFENVGTPNATVTTYLNGVGDLNITDDSVDDVQPVAVPVSLPDPKDISIIINGVKEDQDYNGAYLLVDDVIVYNTALSSKEVQTLAEIEKGTSINASNDVKAFDWDNVFLTDEELALLMDPSQTDNSRLAASGYTYFVYDSRGTAKEYAPLGYWDGTDGQGNAATSATNALAKNTVQNSDGLVLGKFNNVQGTGKGWYLIGHKGSTGVWDLDYNDDTARTAKRLFGLPSVLNNTVVTYYDSITLPDNTAISDRNTALKPGGSNHSYQPSPNESTRADSAMKFYLDGDGYLRCFYAPSNSYFGASYVYRLEDSEYVKVESLQRALGAFVTELAQVSPKSRVAATRFSTELVPDGETKDGTYFDASRNELGKLVLLDWTDDAAESAGILSLKRGDGTTKGFTNSQSGMPQYNYGMTGSTSTKQGLKAFKNLLAGTAADGLQTGNVDKYLIIFTDGKDTDITNSYQTSEGASGLTWPEGVEDENDANVKAYMDAYQAYITHTNADNTYKLEALQLAKDLRDQGYTIFTVMLSGGPVVKGYQDYTDSHVFLREMSGNAETMTNDAKDAYFFSIETASNTRLEQIKQMLIEEGIEDPTPEQVRARYEKEGISSDDLLTMIFSQQILNKMTHTLSGYSVKDYIDPRFDLVNWTYNNVKNEWSATIWHLNAGGQVVVGDGEKTFKVTNATTDKIQLSEESDNHADTPYLRYDGDKGMYYLEWVNQSIPGAAIGMTDLAVWNAQVTVHAKDDFIGGNAVMTNGNMANMNYVYHPSDTNQPSSGIVDRLGDDGYPSKGFPRTVVNVPPTNAYIVDDELIYMGEPASKAEAAKKLIEAAESNKTRTLTADGKADPLVRYYWEYLLRYAKYNKKSVDDLVAQIVSGNGLTLEYAYLPSRDGANQTGTPLHEQDVMGSLVYKLVPVDELNWTKDQDILGRFGYNDLSKDDYARQHEDSAAETKDTLTRVSKLVVTFYPRAQSADVPDRSVVAAPPAALEDIAYREDANKKLVSDTEYLWNKDFKPADPEALELLAPAKRENVGAWVDANEEGTYLIEGFYITEIVSGEVTLQVEVADNKTLAGQTLTYVANLVRTDLNGKETVVGQLKLESAAINGQQTLYNATFVPAEAYAYMGYHMDERSEYGLPIGTYTLKALPELCKAPVGYFFADASVIIAPDQYVSRLFTKGTQFAAAAQYMATGNTAKTAFILGDQNADGLYTDYRFGLFRVPLLSTERGVLTVNKLVTGTAGDQTKRFDFMVMLSDTNVNGAYGDMTFSNGVATFTLKHGESKTATGLPVGMNYSVSEPNAAKEGYVVTSSGQSGVISASTKAEATFINHMDAAPSVPQTGDETNLILWATLLALSTLGIGFYFIMGRSRKN